MCLLKQTRKHFKETNYMLKKLVISLLLAVAIACGVGFGITTAMAAEDNTSSVEVSESADLKIAKVSPYDLYPTGTEANVPIKIMEGDDEICTIMIDPGLVLVANYSASYSSLRILKNSTVKIIPNESFSIKKIFVQGHNSTTASTSIAIDAAQGTKIDYKNLTDDEKTLLGNPSNSMSVATFEINDEYAVTEETPYEMTTSMQFYLKTIHVVYERASYTKTYDCTNDNPTNAPVTVKVGDASFLIYYEGSYNNGYPAYGKGSFKITICPVPGHVINYVIFTSSLDNPFEASELEFPELEATYENGNLKVTGMQPGQTYVLYSRGSAKGLLTSITVNYIEHEHTGIYEPGSDETHHFKQCECLWRVDEEEHAFGEGEITLEPTHQRKGKAKYTCTNAECGYEKEEQVAPNFADTEVSLDKELRYNGSIQFAVYTVKYKGYEVGSANYKKSGTTYAKEPGDYTFTIEPTGSSIFVGEKVFTYTIKKGSVAKPALDTTEFYFDNTVKTYTVEENDLYSVLDNSNQQTNPGSYKVRIALNNPEFSEWEDGTTDVLEYDFVINKGNYDMSAVVFEDKTVTYNGSAFSIEATNLPDGVTVSYENNGKTDAGEYDIIAKFTGDAVNYNLIADKTAKLIINKANVVKPTADSTVFTYNGQEQTYALATSDLYTISSTKATNAGSYTITVALKDKTNYQWNDQTATDLTYSFVIGKATYDMSAVVFENKNVTYNGSAFSLEVTNLPNGVTVSYENNGKTVVGEYTVTAKFTGDADNYNLIADKTATLTINKATYDMGAVVFKNKTVVYNSSTVFSILATNLPNGVSVTYEGNGKIEAGVYTITAKFTGDANNYNLIADRTATLVIRNATLDFNTGAESNGASNIIISAPEGIDPTKELVVDVIENTEDYQEFVDKNQRVALVYDIKLIQDNVSVQPDGKLQFRILIPEQLRGREFSIVHIHDGNETVIVDYQIDGDYVVFESDKLSEFVFVYDMGSLVWLIILLSVIATLETLFLVYLSKKKNNGKKLASVYPPFVFGMFLSKGQLALVIILAVAVVALTIVSILWAIKVFGKKKNAEEIACTEQTEEKVNDRSFSARLSQCSPEVIEYYNDIKNELLSYSKVKAKTSLRHETFRVGMPTVAKLTIRGKSLYLFLALDPNDYKESKYKIKDMSNINANKDVPTMYKINLPRRAVYAKELIADLMKKFDAEKNG